jgi:hypothetical protein
MTGHAPVAFHVDRHDDAGLPASILAALEREAAHLTRRDGLRRHVVRWGDDPPSIETVDPESGYAPLVLATIDLA